MHCRVLYLTFCTKCVKRRCFCVCLATRILGLFHKKGLPHACAAVPEEEAPFSAGIAYRISMYSPASALFMLRTAQNLPHMLQVSL